MSIVVTCECAMTYRLPSRYAGKRCRCRECGTRIHVPEESSEGTKKKKTKKRDGEGGKRRRKRKRKRLKSSATTRRLGAEAGAIISEGQALRRAVSNRRPVSDSIHQLAPLHSGSRMEPGLAPIQQKRRKKKKKKKRDAAKTKSKQAETQERPKRPKKKARKKEAPQKPAKSKTRSKGKTEAKKATHAKAKGRKKGTTARRGGAARTSLAKRRTERLGSKGKTKARATRSLGRRGRGSSDDEGTSRKPSPTRNALLAVLAIVGVLCLGIGLIVGGVFTKDGVSTATSDVDEKLTYIEQLMLKQQWDFAKKEAAALEETIKQSKRTQGLKELYGFQKAIDQMVGVLALPEDDDETRLRHMLKFVTSKHVGLRLGAVSGLKKLRDAPEARRAMVTLTKDSDPQVVEKAKLAMVEVGGKLSIPFLVEVIEKTAGTGSKMSDLALTQALQIHDAAVVPVLIKVLEVRKTASPKTLRRVLNHLSEVADSKACADAARPFVKHEDEGVRQAAQSVVDVVG